MPQKKLFKTKKFHMFICKNSAFTLCNARATKATLAVITEKNL